MAISAEAEQLLKDWNNGVLRGAQRRLSRELGFEENTISQCLSGRQNPSKRMITGMSKLFNKPEEELRSIFCKPKENLPYTQNNIKSKGHFQQIINGYKEEAIAAQMRTLEAKMDLIIQILKEGK